MILAGGGAFLLLAFAVLVLGGSPPPVQPGGPNITEIKDPPKEPSPPAAGGKFGAATSALTGTNR